MPPPLRYDPQTRARLFAELMARRAAGESFEAICATPGWPSRRTLGKWLAKTPHIAPPAVRRPPVRWSQALADEICERFHVQSLREICEDPAMPDRTSLAQWRRTRPDFAARLDAIRKEAGQPRTGRRSTYSDLVGDDVAEAVLATGTIAAACRREGMPPQRTVRDWARTHPEFARGVLIAMEMAHEAAVAPLLKAVDAWLNNPNAQPEDAPLGPRAKRPSPGAKPAGGAGNRLRRPAGGGDPSLP